MRFWIGWTAAAALVAMVLATGMLAGGCVQVKEPLVKIGSDSGSSARPDTQVRAGDSDEVRALKDRVATLERQLADARQDADKEKAKRKAAEDRIDDMEDQVKALRKELERR